MARSTSRLAFLVVVLMGMGLVTASCDITVTPDEGDVETRAYAQGLAVLTQALDDFDSYTRIASATSSACFRSYGLCGSNPAVMTTTYTDCPLPDSRSLVSGATKVEFGNDANATNICFNNNSGNGYSIAPASFKKTVTTEIVSLDGYRTLAQGYIRIDYTGVGDAMSGTLLVNSMARSHASSSLSWAITSIPQTLVVSGRASSNTRQISSGTLKVTESSTTATVLYTMTFSNLIYGSTACCYPTSGAIVSSLSGSRTGSESITFSATCGQAQYSDGTTVKTVTLTGGCE